MTDRKLPVPAPRGELVQAGGQLRLLRKLLPARTDEFVDFCCDHAVACFTGLMHFYPLSKNLLSRYQEQWDWMEVSKNSSLPWNEAFIGRFNDCWDWRDLSLNEGLPWSEELFARYEDRWDFGLLCFNENFPWSEALISRYEDRWYWNALSENEGLPWSEALITRFREKWAWDRLSKNPAIIWDEALVDKYYDDWHWISVGQQWNPVLPLSYSLIQNNTRRLSDFRDNVEKFGKHLERAWENASRNQGVPWSEDWSESAISRYEDQWRWHSLSENERLPWSEELVVRYEDRWDGHTWHRLSRVEDLPWSEGFIDRYSDRWSWSVLSTNEGLPWSQALLSRFEGFWRQWPTNSRLAENEALPWSMDLLRMNPWIKPELGMARSLWESVFSPNLNDDLVQEIMDRIGRPDDYVDDLIRD